MMLLSLRSNPQTQKYCYDLKLELRLHLDKDLRGVKRNV